MSPCNTMLSRTGLLSENCCWNPRVADHRKRASSHSKEGLETEDLYPELSECSGLNSVPKNVQHKPQPPEPVSVTSFGKRVFANMMEFKISE